MIFHCKKNGDLYLSKSFLSYGAEDLILCLHDGKGKKFFYYELGVENGVAYSILAPTTNERIEDFEKNNISIVDMIDLDESIMLRILDVCKFETTQKEVHFREIKDQFEFPSKDVFLRDKNE